VPFDDLLVRVVVSTVAWESVGEHQTTERVAAEISAVGIELTPTIIGLHVDIELVEGAGYLNVTRGLEDLGAGDGASWHDTRAMSRLGAPCNALALGITDES